MASTAKKAPALIVSQVGEPDHATGAVDYRATVTGCGLPISFSFTLPRYGLVTNIGDSTFRYTPMPRVNAQSDIFTVIADDGNGAVADSTVTWINDNRAPVAVAPPTVWPPDPATGAVTVSSNIVDPDGDPLTFTLETPHPQCGEVAIDRDGTFTYVPFPSARDHNGPAKDTFGLRAADPRGASVYITVTVPITPRTTAPAPPISTAICAPDPVTGIVIGTCGDRTNCTYTASAPAKGTVVIDAATGAWAYRPAATARHDAVADHATNADQHDTFTVTFTDNDGGTTDIPVTVSLVTMMTVPSYAVTAQIPVGVTPVGMAISPRGDYVYVTSFVDHAAVTVLRTEDATITTIPLTFRPEGIVVAADGRHLYVADPTGNRIAVIDTTDRSTVFVPVGNKPFRMALCGADLYVANNQDGTVSVIDTIEAILTRTIAVGGHPYAIAAGGGRVYITDYSFYGGQSTHSLSVIDAAGGVVVDSIPVGYYPTGIAMSPNGRRCYVSNDEGSYTTSHPGTTTVIDTATNTVVETLPVGGNSIAVGEGGVEVYVVSHCRDGQFTSTLSTIDTITGGVTGVLIYGMPDALAAHEDRIYLTDPWHSSVLQVSARSTLVVDTNTANGWPALTITRIAGDDETVVFETTISDPDGDDVTCTATQPFSGSVSDLGGGGFRYTPNGRAAKGFVDHFAITADDGHGGVVTKTVAVPIV